MSAKELRRAEVLARVKRKELRLREGAELMGVSYRQAKRLRARYRAGGARGLRHGDVGRRNRAQPAAHWERVLVLLRGHYGGEAGQRFGPTLAAEHLASEHGVEVKVETLRRRMLAAGLWGRTRRRSARSGSAMTSRSE
ncbi:MAG TPA: helix-turn-helix domain-containing protein [Terriglobales bacterium]|nr:helix-turn-helix domain-containing protein [Terriglobales bacterium]